MDEKNGLWKTNYIDSNNEKTLTFTNFVKDLKEGSFQEVQGDSLIIGTYKKDELHGIYKIYIDQTRFLGGGLINTDVSKLTLITEGQYNEGYKVGNWKFYDITATLRTEGNYNNNSEYGEWKYYYTNWSKEGGGTTEYAKKLHLTENYSNGKLNGKSMRFSYLQDKKYPCDELDENGVKLDSCVKQVYIKILETSYYKDNELNGDYELLDSINQIITKGKYLNGLKNGDFIEKYAEKDSNNVIIYVTEKGKYINDKREGLWSQYYKEDIFEQIINYKNGVFDGENIIYNEKQKPLVINTYINGKIKRLKRFNSSTNQIEREITILENNGNSIICNKTEYVDDSIISEDYWMKKDGSDSEFEIEFYANANTKDEDYIYKNGSYILSNLKEQKLITGNYTKNKKTSLWTFFYPEQNIKIESNFSENQRLDERYFNLNGEVYSGEFVYTDIEKSIKETRKIKNGLRNGKTIFEDLKTNKTINKEKYKDGVLEE
jgi:antitoxin component YwqK of YwqJK toxin-antitoxin module